MFSSGPCPPIVDSGWRGLGGMVSVGGGAVKKTNKHILSYECGSPFYPWPLVGGPWFVAPLALRRAYGEPVVA